MFLLCTLVAVSAGTYLTRKNTRLSRLPPTCFGPAEYLVSITGLPDLFRNVRVAFPDDGTQQDSPEGQHREPDARRHAAVGHYDTVYVSENGVFNHPVMDI